MMPSEMIPAQQLSELQDDLVRLAAAKDAEIAALTNAKAAATDQLADVVAKRVAQASELKAAKAEIAALKADLQVVSEAVDKLRDRTAKLFDQRSQLRDEIAALTEQRDEAREAEVRLTRGFEAVERERREWHRQCNVLTEQRDRAMAVLREIESDSIDHVAVALARKALAALDTPSSPSLPETT